MTEWALSREKRAYMDIASKYFIIGNRIKELRGNISQKNFAKNIDVPFRTYQRYEYGERMPPGNVLQKIAEVCNVTVDYVLTGHNERSSADRIGEDMPLYNDKEFVFVSQMSGEISAGGGLIADNSIEMRIAFRREWIQRKGDPHNMSLIRVSGDSMEPTLLSGDLVLIDHNRNVFDPQGGIYAVSMDGIIMIKRIQLIYTLNKVRIISDNSRYQTIEAEPSTVKINGKVIWYGRELER